MKRLFAVLLAAALLAGGAFALDVVAGIRIDADLLNYDGNDFHVLQVKNGTAQHENPIQFSVGTEKVGGQVKIWPAGVTDGDRTWSPVLGGWTLWFKPLNGLQVTLGNIGTNLFCEQLDWWRTATAFGDLWGAGISYNNSGFFIEAQAATGQRDGWLFGNDDPEVPGDDEDVLAPIYFKAGYGNEDIGTIGGFFAYAEGGSLGWNHAPWWGGKTKFGLGYANTFGSTYTFANVILGMNDDLDILGVELWVAPNLGVVSIASYFAFDYVFDNDEDAATEADPCLQFDVKANFNLDLPTTPYVRVSNWERDLIADNFGGLYVQPGVGGGFNGMSYDVGVRLNIPAESGDFSFSVPVVLKYNF